MVPLVYTHVPKRILILILCKHVIVCVRSTKTDRGPERGGASAYIYSFAQFMKCSQLEMLILDSWNIFTIITVLEE